MSKTAPRTNGVPASSLSAEVRHFRAHLPGSWVPRPSSLEVWKASATPARSSPWPFEGDGREGEGIHEEAELARSAAGGADQTTVPWPSI